MIIVDCVQGTPEWHAGRCGKATGSRICDIVRKTTAGGVSKMRETYKGELIAERLSGFQAETGFLSAAVQRGKDNENLAVGMYEFMYDVVVVRVGLVIHPTIPMAAVSPDGLVGDDGMIEIKCPNSSTHTATLRGSKIDPDYFKQMQWGMACTGRNYCDFISFDDRFPPEMQLSVRRVQRDVALISDLEREVTTFLAEVAKDVAELRAMYPVMAEAAE